MDKQTTTLNDGQVSQYRNEKLGFVFQFANLLPDLTVLENVMLPQQIQQSSEDIRQNATDLLIKVGLEDQIPQTLKQNFWRTSTKSSNC